MLAVSLIEERDLGIVGAIGKSPGDKRRWPQAAAGVKPQEIGGHEPDKVKGQVRSEGQLAGDGRRPDTGRQPAGILGAQDPSAAVGNWVTIGEVGEAERQGCRHRQQRRLG